MTQEKKQSELDLDKIEEELKKIFPSPWGISKDGEGGWVIFHSGNNDESCDFASDILVGDSDEELWKRNLQSMKFISKSPETIAALMNRVRELEKALEFYADENNTVRLCMVGGPEGSTLCANVDICKTAQEALKRGSDEV